MPNAPTFLADFEVKEVAKELLQQQGVPPTPENFNRAVAAIQSDQNVARATPTGHTIYNEFITQAAMPPGDRFTDTPADASFASGVDLTGDRGTVVVNEGPRAYTGSPQDQVLRNSGTGAGPQQTAQPVDSGPRSVQSVPSGGGVTPSIATGDIGGGGVPVTPDVAIDNEGGGLPLLDMLLGGAGGAAAATILAESMRNKPPSAAPINLTPGDVTDSPAPPNQPIAPDNALTGEFLGRQPNPALLEGVEGVAAAPDPNVRAEFTGGVPQLEQQLPEQFRSLPPEDQQLLMSIAQEKAGATRASAEIPAEQLFLTNAAESPDALNLLGDFEQIQQQNADIRGRPVPGEIDRLDTRNNAMTEQLWNDVLAEFNSRKAADLPIAPESSPRRRRGGEVGPSGETVAELNRPETPSNQNVVIDPESGTPVQNVTTEKDGGKMLQRLTQRRLDAAFGQNALLADVRGGEIVIAGTDAEGNRVELGAIRSMDDFLNRAMPELQQKAGPSLRSSDVRSQAVQGASDSFNLPGDQRAGLPGADEMDLTGELVRGDPSRVSEVERLMRENERSGRGRKMTSAQVRDAARRAAQYAR